jgi:hypothetical protein
MTNTTPTFNPIPGRVYTLLVASGKLITGHVNPCNFTVGVGYAGPFTRVSIVTQRTGRFQGYVDVSDIVDFELL